MLYIRIINQSPAQILFCYGEFNVELRDRDSPSIVAQKIRIMPQTVHDIRVDNCRYLACNYISFDEIPVDRKYYDELSFAEVLRKRDQFGANEIPVFAICKNSSHQEARIEFSMDIVDISMEANPHSHVDVITYRDTNRARHVPMRPGLLMELAYTSGERSPSPEPLTISQQLDTSYVRALSSSSCVSSSAPMSLPLERPTSPQPSSSSSSSSSSSWSPVPSQRLSSAIDMDTMYTRDTGRARSLEPATQIRFNSFHVFNMLDDCDIFMTPFNDEDGSYYIPHQSARVINCTQDIINIEQHGVEVASIGFPFKVVKRSNKETVHIFKIDLGCLYNYPSISFVVFRNDSTNKIDYRIMDEGQCVKTMQVV